MLLPKCQKKPDRYAKNKKNPRDDPKKDCLCIIQPLRFYPVVRAVRCLDLAENGVIGDISLDSDGLAIEIDKGILLVQETDLVGMDVLDDAEDAGKGSGGLCAGGNDAALALDGSAVEEVAKADGNAVIVDSLADLSTGNIIAESKGEGGGRSLARGVHGRGSEGCGEEEGGDGSDGEHFEDLVELVCLEEGKDEWKCLKID